MQEIIKKIEEFLGIQLEEYNRQKTTPSWYELRGGDIWRLQLDNVNIENIDILLPYLPKIKQLMGANQIFAQAVNLIPIR